MTRPCLGGLPFFAYGAVLEGAMSDQQLQALIRLRCHTALALMVLIACGGEKPAKIRAITAGASGRPPIGLEGR